jgi:YidC/Oxa1 family membrane protein insertase
MWTVFVDLFRSLIFAAAHVCGGSLGGGVLVVSFVIRLALMPLTIRIARRALDQQRKLAELGPQLTRLNKRFARDPARLLAETRSLHQQHGVRTLDPQILLGGLAQTPFLAALYSAVRGGLGAGVRFLWVGDLARPDRLVIVLVASLSILVAKLTPTPSAAQQATTVALAFAGVLTIAFLWSTSSAIALSWGAGSAVSVLQNWLVRRNPGRRASA